MADKNESDLYGQGMMTVKDAAQFLSLSRSKLYQLMENGKLRYSLVDGSRRIAKNALIELVRVNERGGWRQ